MRLHGLFALCLISVPATSLAGKCTDVPSTHWAAEAVEIAAPVMQSCAFNGNRLFTRRMAAELASTLMDSHGIPLPAAPTRPVFADISAEASAKAILMATEAGLMTAVDANGDPGGDSFRPDGPLTRFQMAKLLVGLLDMRKRLSLPTSPVTYADVPTTHWAHEAVQHAVASGILKGFDGKFNGDKFVDRYQTAVIVKKLLEALK